MNADGWDLKSTRTAGAASVEDLARELVDAGVSYEDVTSPVYNRQVVRKIGPIVCVDTQYYCYYRV